MLGVYENGQKIELEPASITKKNKKNNGRLTRFKIFTHNKRDRNMKLNRVDLRHFQSFLVCWSNGLSIDSRLEGRRFDSRRGRQNEFENSA